MKPFYESDYPHTTERGSLAPLATDTVDARVLSANTSEAHPIPAGATHVLFSANGDFFARFGSSGVVAAVPGGDVSNGTASMMNPAARRIPPEATHVALVAAEARIVTLEFYGASA